MQWPKIRSQIGELDFLHQLMSPRPTEDASSVTLFTAIIEILETKHVLSGAYHLNYNSTGELHLP